MTDPAPGSIVGYVYADSRSFRDGRFQPVNDYYGRFHPGVKVSKGGWMESKTVVAVLPPLAPGEFYQVREETDKTEGRGGSRAAGNFLVYQDAYRASAGKGVQGSAGAIVIGTPREAKQITALHADGSEVVIAIIPEFTYYSVASRLVIEAPSAE
jgi:hypothetical protein